MKNILPIAASCLLAGGAIGYIAGNSGSNSEKNESADAKSKAAASGSSRTSSVSGASGGGNSKERKPKTYEEVAATPGQTARLQALVDLYSGLDSDEFAGEAEKLDNLPFNERILSAYILFAAWAEVSPYEAFDHANSKMGRTGMFVKPTILQSWASTDPKAASRYYESNKSEFAMMGMMGGGRGGSSGAGTIAAEWAKQDPEGALAWAKTLEGRDQEQATVKALSQIATTDPERAAGLTLGLEGDSLSSANSSIASEWAKKDWNAAEDFVKGLPVDQQGDALGAAVRSLASENPTLAATKALEIPEGNARDEAVESVAEAMARENPADAAKWVVANGTEKAQKDAMRDVMGSWVNQDAAAAKTWAVEQPEGAVRDAAVSSYVMSDSKGNPQENIKLAETITDEGSRGWAIGMTTMRWMGEDSEAATEYIQSSDVIDDRMKDRILRRGEGGGRPPGR
tara:strand:+ start:559 stop:1929 length:1371 start_codon:yes stop_codon:yes gene_type:complete